MQIIDPFDQPAVASGGIIDPFDSAPAVAPAEPKVKREGWLGTIQSGVESAGRAIGATYDAITGDNESIVERADAAKNVQKDAALESFYGDIEASRKQLGDDPGFFDSVSAVGGAIWRNKEGAAKALVEQLPNSAAALGGGWAGMKAGAAAGTVVAPGLGTAIGAIGGGLAGMFAGNAALEIGNKAIESAQDGVVTDEERTGAIQEGAVKAGVITGVDAVTLGASKWITGATARAMEAATRRTLVDAGVDVTSRTAVEAARKSPEITAAVRRSQEEAAKLVSTAGQKALRYGGAGALETLGEGTGEYLGELAATGKADMLDAVLESALSAPQSAAEIAWGVSRNDAEAREKLWDVAEQQEQPKQPTLALPNMGGPTQYVFPDGSTTTDPEAARQFIETLPPEQRNAAYEQLLNGKWQRPADIKATLELPGAEQADPFADLPEITTGPRTAEQRLAGIAQDADAVREKMRKERDLLRLVGDSRLNAELDRADERDAITRASGQDVPLENQMQAAARRAVEREESAAAQRNTITGTMQLPDPLETRAPEAEPAQRPDMAAEFERARQAEEARKAAELEKLAQESRLPAAEFDAERGNRIAEAAGIGEQQPTAIELAMKRAQGAQPSAAPQTAQGMAQLREADRAMAQRLLNAKRGPSGTVTESAADINAQVAAYAEGKRGPVFVDGEVSASQAPEGMSVVPSEFGGNYIVRSEDAAAVTQIEQQTGDREIARQRILGYTQSKPDAMAGGNAVVVQARNEQGQVVKQELVDGNDPQAVQAAQESQAQAGTVEVTTPDAAMAKRIEGDQSRDATQMVEPAPADTRPEFMRRSYERESTARNAAKKNLGARWEQGHEVIKVGPGAWGIVERKQRDAEPAAKRGPVPRGEAKSLLELVRRAGGIAKRLENDIAGEPTVRRKGYPVGVFREGGMGEDMLAELMQQHGYITEADVMGSDSGAEVAFELMRSALAGERVVPIAERERMMAEAEEKAYRDNIRQQAREAGIKIIGRKFSDLENDVLALRERQHEAQVRALEAEDRAAYEAVLQEVRDSGIIEEGEIEALIERNMNAPLRDLAQLLSDAYQARLAEINSELAEARAPRELNEEEYQDAAERENQGDAGGNAARASSERDEAGRREADQREAAPDAAAGREGFQLESQTERELKERIAALEQAEAQRKREEEAAERRRQADAERDSFTLTGSDRPADVLAAQGQASIFDQPAPTQAPTASAQSRPAPSQRSESAQPVTVTAQRRVRTENGMVVEVDLSNGKMVRMQRLNGVEGMGLAGWHDIDNASVTSYLGDTKEMAIEEVLRSENAKQDRSRESRAATAVTETPAFRRWFGESKIVDDDGNPRVMYHGTTHPDIEVFRRAGTPESFLGQGPYFTSSAPDASANYAGVGPDLTSRIERESERIADDFHQDDYAAEQILQDYFDDAGIDLESIGIEDIESVLEELKEEYADAAIQHAARKQLKGESDGLMMPVFLKVERPFDMTDAGRDLYLEYDTNEDGDIIGEERGEIVALVDAINEVSGGYDVSQDDIAEFTGWLYESGLDGVSPREIFDYGQRNLQVYANSDGESTSFGQFWQDVLRETGLYDGMIQDADLYFGTQRRGFGGARIPGMAGVTPGTIHVVPFSPEQVKSATGNNGNFDASRPSILESRGRSESAAAISNSVSANTDKVRRLMERAASILGEDAALVRFAEQLLSRIDGQPISGRYTPSQLRGAIEVALNSRNPMAALNHESFHHALEAFFTPAQARIIKLAFAPGGALAARVKKQLRLDGETAVLADRDYLDAEELSAFGFQYYAAGRLKFGGEVGRIFKAMADMLERVRNWIRGAGFNTVEELFAALDQGKAARRGQRGRGAQRESRAGDPYADLYADMMPDRPVKEAERMVTGQLNGKLAMANGSVALINPRKTSNLHGFHADGDSFMSFELWDRKRREIVGYVELEMAGNKPVALHDIYVADAYRRSGAAANAIGMLLTNDPQGTFTIVEVLESARGFWESIGTSVGFDGNGQIGWNQFYEAREARRAGRESRGGADGQNQAQADVRNGARQVQGATNDRAADGRAGSNRADRNGRRDRMAVEAERAGLGARESRTGAATPAMAVESARAKAAQSRAAFRSFDAQAEQVGDADRYFDLVGQAIDDEAALVAALDAMPKEAFGAQANTPDGRMMIVNASAQQPGKWQLTYFGKDGAPWMDVQHTTRAAALKEMVSQADIGTLVAENAQGRESRAGQGRQAGSNNSASQQPSSAAPRSIVERARQSIKWLDSILNPLGNMADQRAYLVERYKTMGAIAKWEEIGKQIYDTLKKADAADAKATFSYLTTKGATPDGIKNAEVRAKAVEVKAIIDKVGQALVKRGLISQASYEKYRDQYLPRMYLRYLLDDSINPFAATGAGRKTSNLGYTKERKDLPVEVREVLLGEVTDPAFLSATGIVRAMRDLFLLHWLEQISGNNSWVLPKGTVEWNGQRVTPHWLKKEAEQLRKQADFYDNPDNERKARQVAREMDEAADAAFEAMGQQDVNIEDYKQMPDTARYGRLRGLWVRSEIYDDIMGVAGMNPDDSNWVSSLFGYGGIGTKITQVFKTTKVTLNPASQVRNFVSNMVLLQLSGVPLHRIPGLIRKAVNEMANGGRHYQVAKKYGITESSFSSQELFRMKKELLDLEERMHGLSPWGKVRKMAGVIVDFAGEKYQKVEELGKVMKIIDGMDRQQLSEQDAVLEAQKWLFDYSLVPAWMRYARNAPIGAPFLTFTMKVLPRLMETATTHPQRFLPWIGLWFGLAALSAASLGYDDDEMKAARESLPEWARDKSHVALLPFKDDDGRINYIDLGYHFPWTMWVELAQNAVEGNPKGMLQSMGALSGPIPDLLIVARTGIDPFTGQEVWNEAEPESVRWGKTLGYLYNMAVPPWLATNGPLSKLGNEDTDKFGNLKATTGQAIGQGLGFPYRKFNPAQSRAQNLQVMQYELSEAERALERRLRSMQRATPEERKEVIDEYVEHIRDMAKELQDYAKRSQMPARPASQP